MARTTALDTPQSFGAYQKRRSCFGKRGTVTAAPAHASILAAVVRRSRIQCPEHVQTTKGTPHKGGRGWRLSTSYRRCGTRKEKTRWRVRR